MLVQWKLDLIVFDPFLIVNYIFYFLISNAYIKRYSLDRFYYLAEPKKVVFQLKIDENKEIQHKKRLIHVGISRLRFIRLFILKFSFHPLKLFRFLFT